MTTTELDDAVRRWVSSRLSQDQLLVGVVPCVSVETVEKTTDLRRSADRNPWQPVEPVRMEAEVPERTVAAQVERLLDDRFGDFFAEVGARLLAEATAPKKSPPDLDSALARDRKLLRAVVFPLGYQQAGLCSAAGFPGFHSLAKDDLVILAYDSASAFRLKYDQTIKQDGSVMRVWLSASIVRGPSSRPCIAYVSLP